MVDENRWKMMKYRMAIYGAATIEEKLKLLKEAYAFAKSIAPAYEEVLGFYGFSDIAQAILECERAIPLNFIINNKPKMADIQINGRLDQIKENEVVLDKIVSEARKHLLLSINIF